jgi:hypothetical protein
MITPSAGQALDKSSQPDFNKETYQLNPRALLFSLYLVQVKVHDYIVLNQADTLSLSFDLVNKNEFSFNSHLKQIDVYTGAHLKIQSALSASSFIYLNVT